MKTKEKYVLSGTVEIPADEDSLSLSFTGYDPIWAYTQKLSFAKYLVEPTTEWLNFVSIKKPYNISYTVDKPVWYKKTVDISITMEGRQAQVSEFHELLELHFMISIPAPSFSVRSTT